MDNSTYDIMQKMSDSLHENFNNAISKNITEFSEILLHLKCFENWEKIIENPQLKIVLKEVIHDFISSQFMAANGMYRNAYICLRSALELGISLLYFEDHNYEFLLWQHNQYDVKWSVLKDRDSGVLSNKYFQLFVPDLNYNAFIDLVEKMYHDCSEYVHGKYNFMQINFMNERIKYDDTAFKKWNKCWVDEIKLINTMYCIRFNQRLLELSDDSLTILKENVKEIGLGRLINE